MKKYRIKIHDVVCEKKDVSYMNVAENILVVIGHILQKCCDTERLAWRHNNSRVNVYELGN